MSWSREQVQLLIDNYKMHPCLYAVKHKEYKNKHARNNALTLICNEIEKIRPGTGVSDIKSKFNNIRTNFLLQYRKYSSSFHSGMGEDEVYKPNIWYFEAMKFILEHVTPRESIDSITTSPGPSQLSSNESSQPYSHLSLIENEEASLANSQKVDCENDGTSTIHDKEAATDLQCISQKDKKIIIHSVHHLTPSTSKESSPTCSASVVRKNGERLRKRKKTVEDENSIIATATDSLREIQKAITSSNCTNPNSETHLTNLTQSQVFGNFVAKQLSFIEENNEELFLDVQHEICNIIYRARKNCNKQNLDD